MKDLPARDTLTGFLRDLDNRLTRQERHSHGRAAPPAGVSAMAATAEPTPVPFPRTYGEAKAWAEAGTMVPDEGEPPV